MAQRNTVDNGIRQRGDPEAFLRRRGIFPANGGFTAPQLEQELTRRGWRWRSESGRVEATKSLTSTGSVSTRIVSDEADHVAGLVSVLVEAIQFDDRQGLLVTGPIDADIVVRAPDQRVIAIGEAKGGQSPSPELAARYRESFVGHSNVFALAPYFLMIWREVAFLWDQRVGIDPTSPPTLEFAMAPVIAHYLPWLREGERPGATEIALAVAQWLDDLANPIPHRPSPVSDVFAGTDFLEAIRGASVLTDAAA
jgi:hypothetical protein